MAPVRRIAAGLLIHESVARGMKRCAKAESKSRPAMLSENMVFAMASRCTS